MITDCSNCPFGTFISTNCSAYQDAQCTTCSQCGQLEYEISPCIGTQDRVCGSCQSCYESDEVTRRICTQTSDRYVFWALDNCCRDYEGNLVSFYLQVLHSFNAQTPYLFVDVLICYFTDAMFNCGKTKYIDRT